jgi:hypothetical protein
LLPASATPWILSSKNDLALISHFSNGFLTCCVWDALRGAGGGGGEAGWL